jgi:hypothetical protein
VFRTVDAPEKRGLQDKPDHGNAYRDNDQKNKKRKNRITPYDRAEGERQVGADHVEGPVGEIDHPQDPEHERQPGSDDEQHHAHAEPVDE